MNLLSIGAALGVVQAIFERGWLGGLTGRPARARSKPSFRSWSSRSSSGSRWTTRSFLVSRIHEEWQHRGDATAAVREGVASTGRVITRRRGP